jgi:hypothetical protein
MMKGLVCEEYSRSPEVGSCNSAITPLSCTVPHSHQAESGKVVELHKLPRDRDSQEAAGYLEDNAHKVLIKTMTIVESHS